MLNYIWLGLVLCAVVIGGLTGRLEDMTKQGFDKATMAVMDIGLPLVAIMTLWLGIMRLAEKSGMVQILARALRPIMVWLFPDVPPEHPAMGSMMMNMAANMLGLSNAATPLGLRAMKDLETLNPRPGTATNAMCTFLAINTSSITLIPVTAIGIFVAQHAKNPTAIVGPAFCASFFSAACAICVVKLLERLPIFGLPPVTTTDKKEKADEVKTEAAINEIKVKPLTPLGIAALIVYFAFFAFLAFFWLDRPEGLMESLKKISVLNDSKFFTYLPYDVLVDRPIVRIVRTISVLSIPMLLTFFPLYAALRGLKVYEELVEGGKEGFQVVLRIIPNLVTILTAIGLFRGAGGIELLTTLLTPVMHAVQYPPELLSMAIMRPLSGSGTLGFFSDIVTKYGADSLLGRTAGVMYGSTETTFYVLAVYFGSVGIKRTRHAVLAGLTADVVSLFVSVWVCKMVFGG